MSKMNNDACGQRAAILVVDDEPDIRQLVKTCLEIEGFDVITAADGLDGLERYKENQDRIQMVVTDLDMPVMNGADMIRRIFDLSPEVKVIVASGRGSYTTRETGQRSGTSRLPKPYSPSELTTAVRLLL